MSMSIFIYRESVGHLFSRAHNSIQSFQYFFLVDMTETGLRFHFCGLNLNAVE